MIPKIFTAKEVDRQKILNTVLMGFSSDPLVRWMCPEAYNYVLFLEFFDGFGGAAIEHDSAYIVDGFKGTALWLPPGIEPDEEKVVKEIEKNTTITTFSIFIDSIVCTNSYRCFTFEKWRYH